MMDLHQIPVWSLPFSKMEKVCDEQEKLLTYYENAGPDYEAWSPNFNMHFGYYRLGMNPFDRERMLEQMNAEVLKRLDISREEPKVLVDMGSGLAATMRHACEKYPLLQCKGVTLVPWQKRQAEDLNERADLVNRIEILLENYTATSFPDNSVDHVIAMESSCYASGADKNDLLREIHRILKPGGSFVIADGFLKSNAGMNFILKKAYRQLCESWALSELGNIHEVQHRLKQLGFSNVEAQNISWKVAPSVAHVPYTVVSFLLKQFFIGKEKMNKERWDNLKSPLLTMVLGLHQKHFGYYLLKGSKPASLENHG